MQFASYMVRAYWGLRFSLVSAVPSWPLSQSAHSCIELFHAGNRTLNFSRVSCMGFLLAQLSSILRSLWIEALIFMVSAAYFNLISSTDLLRILVSSSRLLAKIPNNCGTIITPLGLMLITSFHRMSHHWLLPSEHRSPANIKPT